ncbi:MAG: CHAT domain-containing protein [Acidimicrobiia bacterium]
MTIDSARRRLANRGEIAAALVHRREIDGDAWYRFDATRLESLLASARPEDRLGSVIVLDALNRVPITDLAEVEDPAAASGVLTVGSVIVGFSDEPGHDPQPPRRGSGVATEAGPTAGAGPPAPPPPSPPLPGPPAVVGSEPTPAVSSRTLTRHRGIEGPTVVGPAEPFTVTITVGPDPMPGVVGGVLSIADLPADTKTVELGVTLVSAFEVTDGSGGHGRIGVDVATSTGGPLVFELRPPAPPSWYDPQVGVWVERVCALFTYQGSPCGQLTKEIKVNAAGDPTTAAAARRLETPSESSPIAPLSDQPLDLSIVMTRVGGAASGLYKLALQSPHLPSVIPAADVDLGDDSLRFATQLIRDVGQHLNDRTTDEVLRGIGRTISDHLPDEFWEVLGTVWNAVAGPDVPAEQRRAPAVQLLTEEPHVPWELAVLPEPLDPDGPPFLGAQVDIGRWPLDRLAPPEPSPLATEALGVVVGHYQDARGVRPLPSAVAEAEALAGRFRARSVDALPEYVDAALRGRFDDDGFSFEGLHFAGHGINDPDRSGAYLMLSSGARLSSFVFRDAGVARSGRAFLFLNACQVGTADDILGSYAGVAGFAVRGGFRGFVAPLWSVSDDLAKEVSLGFYEASNRGETVGGYLRSARRRFIQTETDSANATWLAYVYYGHPALKLGGPKDAGGSP